MRTSTAVIAALLTGALAHGADGAWVSIGPGGGGWLWALAVAPDDAGTVYVGCDVGGVYRSSDHGGAWQPVNAGLGNRYVQAIAVDPSDPRIVYVGTRGGVYKSLDRGEHWQLKRSGWPPMETWAITAPVATVAIDPARSPHILAGVGYPRTGEMPDGRRGGIYESDDAAETWRFIEAPAKLTQAQVYSIVFAPDTPRTVLAATNAGVFRSRDGGTMWEESSSGLRAHPALELAADARRPGVFYVTFADEGSQTGGVAKSTDYGASWRVIRSAQGTD